MHSLLISAALNKIITAFCWMLIHSLWQGLFSAVVAGAVLMHGKKASAARKYNVLLILFITFISACVFTFIKELTGGASSENITPLLSGKIDNGISSLFAYGIYTIKRLTANFSGYFSANAPMIVLLWFVFFLFKSVKMMACMVYNHKVKTIQISEPDELWADVVKRFSEKLKIRKAVSLMESGYVKMPVIIGHLKPIILIPVGLMANLPAEQVEAILLHELAHIRRSDYFVNFLQNVAETIFFFNPGLLWISSLLREERENCCDDIALAQTRNKKGFVQALISFKEYELYGSDYATAFPGKKSFLLRRVSRIMGNEHKSFGFAEKLFFSAGLLIFCVTIATAAIAQFKTVSKSTFRHGVLSYQETKTLIVEPIKGGETAKINDIAEISKLKRKMKAGIRGISGKVRKLASIITEQQTIQAGSSQDVEPANVIETADPVSIHLKVNVVLNEKQQFDQDKIAARAAQVQAKLDQEQALKDQAQAIIDQEQARKDQAQAKLDQVQALKDEEQARKDQQQAKIEQQQATRDRENSDIKAKENNQ